MASEIVNVDQAAAWDGPDGTYWAAHQARFDDAIQPHHAQLIAAAAIAPGEAVLDIGCGNGLTSRDAARAAGPGGEVLGVDLSGPMLARAEQSAKDEGLGTIRFEQADAQVHPFEAGAFDVAISRFGVMFFADPVAAFTNIASALRPGGRLAMLVWQALAANEWMTALRNALAELPEDYRHIVVAHYHDDQGLQEIADELCVTESAVRSRLHRARSRLRAILEQSAIADAPMDHAKTGEAA